MVRCSVDRHSAAYAQSPLASTRCGLHFVGNKSYEKPYIRSIYAATTESTTKVKVGGRQKIRENDPRLA